MALTLVETSGASNANTYATEAEAIAYFAARLPLVPPWEDAEDPTAALAMAARVLDSFVQALRIYIPTGPTGGSSSPYYIVRRAWTGLPATTTQKMAWPRTGMYDLNGNVISSSVIPQALKDAQCELAGLLIKSDSTIDNDISVQGITSVKAGSVSVSFNSMIAAHVLPSSVWWLMPSSWLTDELLEPAYKAVFDVVSD